MPSSASRAAASPERILADSEARFTSEAVESLQVQHTPEHAMGEPTLASRTPFAVDVEQGKTYWWCACGRSRRQPFCDGSHKTTEFTPVEYVAGRSERVWFCGCKRSAARPLCDGTHKTLPAEQGSP
jgi:CDGSH-type Zn-finger protein